MRASRFARHVCDNRGRHKYRTARLHPLTSGDARPGSEEERTDLVTRGTGRALPHEHDALTVLTVRASTAQRLCLAIRGGSPVGRESDRLRATCAPSSTRCAPNATRARPPSSTMTSTSRSSRSRPTLATSGSAAALEAVRAAALRNGTLTSIDARSRCGCDDDVYDARAWGQVMRDAARKRLDTAAPTSTGPARLDARPTVDRVALPDLRVRRRDDVRLPSSPDGGRCHDRTRGREPCPFTERTWGTVSIAWVSSALARSASTSRSSARSSSGAYDGTAVFLGDLDAGGLVSARSSPARATSDRPRRVPQRRQPERAVLVDEGESRPSPARPGRAAVGLRDGGTGRASSRRGPRHPRRRG